MTEATAQERQDWADFVTPANPFASAEICPLEPSGYLALGQSKKRGDMKFVMSRSELFEFANCPRRWLEGFRDGETAEKDWGSLVDIMVLNRGDFNERVAIEPSEYTNAKGETKAWNNNAAACKEWHEDNDGKLIVKPKVYGQAKNAAETLWRDENIKALVEASETQVMFLAEYQDEATGIAVPFKGLIDMVPREPFADCLADLKTCRSAHPKAWESHVCSFGYHLQSAIYLDAYNKATGEARTSFVHVLQESEAPYYCELTDLSAEFIHIGRNAYRAALRKYCECLKTGIWDGYEARRVHGRRITEPPPWILIQ